MAKTERHSLCPDALIVAALAAAIGVVAAREVGLAGAALASAVVAAWAARRGVGPWLCAVPAALGAVDLGTPSLDWPRAGPVSIDGTIARVVRRDLREPSTTVELRQGAGTLLCIVHGTAEVLVGDRIRGAARWPAQVARRSSGRMPLVETSIGAVQWDPGPPSLGRTTAGWRNSLERSLLTHVHGECGDLLCHLVLGRGPRLDRDLVDAHRATGLAHLLAVSGAHASMLAWMIGVLFRIASGRDPWSARAFRRFCLAFLLVYGAITGWEPPMFRALVAFALVLATTASGRRPSVVAALALPALLTALVVPHSLGNASFCLSYAAVAGLGLAGAFRADTLFGARVTAPLHASAWAALATAPLTLLYFGQIAPWTVVLTPVLSPLVAAMLGLGVITALTGVAIPAVATGAATGATWASETYVAAIRAAAKLPFAPVFAPNTPPTWILVLLAASAIAWVSWRRTRASIAVACLALCAPHFAPLAKSSTRFELLAVGHGVCALIVTQSGHNIVVDCGSLGDPFRAARELESALGTRRIVDALILSHADFDHTGGVHELARRVPIRAVWAPSHLRGDESIRALAARGCAIAWIEPGSAREISDDVRIHAPAVPNGDDNDLSLWVRARVGATNLLLPGDAGAAGIKSWMASTDQRRCDVLLLPHHGRGEVDAFRALLVACRPGLGLVSNRDGERDTPLGRAARATGLRVLHTGVRGTIRLRPNDTSFELTTERD